MSALPIVCCWLPGTIRSLKNRRTLWALVSLKRARCRESNNSSKIEEKRVLSTRCCKKSIGRIRGSATKRAAPHRAISRRRGNHRWPRFCCTCSLFFFSSFFPFFFRGGSFAPLFSRSWQIRLMRWTRWDMGQRIGARCWQGRGVTVPWKRSCPGPQSRRELSAGWSPV